LSTRAETVAAVNTTRSGSAPPAPTPPRVVARVAGAVAIVSVVAYAAVSAWYLLRGRLNADEGWYLYAGRLVWRGELPFSDFSFTQMPLVPYVYGIFQVLVPSLYVGRLVSLVFSTAAVALGVRVAWREAGRPAAAAVGVLCVAFPMGVYNLTITKTYALVAFFLVAIVAALTSPMRRTVTFPLAAAAATGLALTRTSGIPLAIIIVAYVLWRAPDAVTRWRAAILPALATVFTAVLVLIDPSAARFGLSSFHQLLWHRASLGTRLDTIVTDRIPEWARDYWGYLALSLLAIAAVACSAEVRRYARERPVYAMTAIGVVLYLVLQLPAGQWGAVEYLTPIVPVLVTMAVVLVSRWCLGASGHDPAFRFAPAVVGVGVVALAALTVFHPSARGFLVDDGAPGSIAAANRVADFVQSHTNGSDQVLALWGQPGTVSSDRDLTPDATFGLFSYEDFTTPRARALHYVNQQRLVDILESRRPAAVVMTALDRVFFNFRGTLSQRRADPTVIPGVLARNYHKAYSDMTWGTNAPTVVEVWLRNVRAS
jgi:hypothetical protein